MKKRDLLLSDFGLGVCKKKLACGCTACLVTTVVELLLGGGMFVND